MAAATGVTTTRPHSRQDSPDRQGHGRRALAGRALLDVAGGGAAGVVATVPMSALLLLARRAGLVGRPPPGRITEGALHAVGADPPEPAHRALTVLSHLGFGAAAGVPFPLLLRAVAPAVLRRAPGARGAVLGAVYGAGVWASAYLGWVPAAGLMPPAHRDRPDRQVTMVASHLVYGAVLGALSARLLRRAPRRREDQGG